MSTALTSTPLRRRETKTNRDSLGPLRRRDRSCQRCGHWAACGIDSVGSSLRGRRLSTRGRPHHPLPYPFRLLPRGLVAPTQHRLRPAPALSRSIPRGWGSTGRGLCVLHEGPTYPEDSRPSSSSSRPSCSTGQAPSQRLRSAEPTPPAQRATALGPGQLASQQCHETPQHPALGRRLWSGSPTSVLRRRTSEPPRSQEAAPRRTSGGGCRPAITTRVARETLCHVDVTVRTVLRWHAFHFQHGD